MTLTACGSSRWRPCSRLPGKGPAEAFGKFVEPLQRALSCVTSSVLIGSHDSRKPGGVRSVAIPPPGQEYVKLPGERGLQFMAAVEYELVKVDDPDRGPWKVRTRQYRYHIVEADFTEIMLFHWHPDGSSDRKGPHMHLGRSQLTPEAVVSHKTHIPTGRVALESVVRLLIMELSVPALRDDWETVLSEGAERFVQWRTWS